jgi:hypothetical protein
MSLICVSSSVIEAIGYENGILRVAFHSGRVYDHPGVPIWIFMELLGADSKGRYYSQNIRGKYR